MSEAEAASLPPAVPQRSASSSSWRGTGAPRTDASPQLLARFAPGASSGGRVRGRSTVGRSNRREHQRYTAVLLQAAAGRARAESAEATLRLTAAGSGSVAAAAGGVGPPLPALSPDALDAAAAAMFAAAAAGDGSTTLERLGTTYPGPHPFRTAASAAELTLGRRGDTVDAAALEAAAAAAAAADRGGRPPPPRRPAAAALPPGGGGPPPGECVAASTPSRAKGGGGPRPPLPAAAQCSFGARPSALPPVVPPPLPRDVPLHGAAREVSLALAAAGGAAGPKLRHERTDFHSTASVTLPPPESGMAAAPLSRAALLAAPTVAADDRRRRADNAASGLARLRQHWAQQAVSLAERELSEAPVHGGKRKAHAVVY